MEINAYNSSLYNANGVKNKNTTEKSSGTSLGIDDFLRLLAAQLANQDMMNPSSDTEFIAQLAQFSSLQSMDALAKMASMNQVTSLVGKKVVVATYDKNNKLETDEGIVEKVTLFGSSIKIFVNGKEYDYSNVMEIKEPSIVEPEKPEDGETEKSEGGDTTK